jgi:ribose transport system permease protein
VISFLGKYKKIFGIFSLLVVVCGFTAAMAPDSFLKAANIENTIRWTALFGIISVGVSFVIMTGGIDLSIGSVVGLVGCLLAMFLTTSYQPLDLLEVTEVEPSARTLVVSGDATIYGPGDRLAFLENNYTVTAVRENRIVVAEEIITGTSTGSLLRLFQVIQLSEEMTPAVWRGTVEMRLRAVTLAGAHPEIEPKDNLNLLQEVGLPQIFTVESTNVQADITTVNFYVRANQRVREPVAVSVAGRSQTMPTWLAISLALLVSLLIGWVHGLLITKVQLQPFVVTLCGLLIYRGLARYLTGDQEQGFGSEYPNLKELAKGDFLQLLTGQEYVFDIPMPFVYLVLLGLLAAIFLNKTIYGRYILALGRNEEAARYSGINTQRMVIVSYMICSFCAGLAAILFALDLNSIQPSGHGEFYELYAIAAAVLGGCSLRGGEGSILGVIIAAAVMRVLNNAINLIDGIDTSTEFAIIGLVILLGVIVDETVRRFAAKRRASQVR